MSKVTKEWLAKVEENKTSNLKKVIGSEWSISAYKNVRGHDGQGFNASIARNGKKVGTVDDDGWGGGFDYNFKDDADNQAYIKFVNSIEHFSRFTEGMNLGTDGDCTTDLLLTIYDAKKTLKRISYAKDGEVYTLPAKHKPTPENLAQVQKCSWWKPEYKMLNTMPLIEAIAYLG